MANNPRILISSTSWTTDEDFSVLLDAINLIEKKEVISQKLIVVITGKGPLKNKFIDDICAEKKNWKHTTFVLGWFSLSDYYSILSCANLGISLHRSSCGLDFPMKIIDMISCKTPRIAALEFTCLNEGSTFLNANIIPFSNAQTLSSIIVDMVDEKLPSIPFKNQDKSFSEYWTEYMKTVLPELFKQD